jgi:hypothetical protein
VVVALVPPVGEIGSRIELQDLKVRHLSAWLSLTANVQRKFKACYVPVVELASKGCKGIIEGPFFSIFSIS